MRCPYCSALEDRVVDTRPSDGDQVIRRRRACGTCNRRFTTYERIELELPAIVKKDGRREPYDRQKLMAGLSKACEKRPVPVEEMERCCSEVERSLQELGEKEVPSSRLGDAVMGALRDLDDVAYLRFASVYLSFKDLEELLGEVQRLTRARRARGEPAAATQAKPRPQRSADRRTEAPTEAQGEADEETDPIEKSAS